MKSIIILVEMLALVLFGSMEGRAQNAEVFFINNNNSPDASRIDVEIRVMPFDTVYVRIRRIRYLHASHTVTVPAFTDLKLRFIQSGTAKTFFTYDSTMYSPAEFTVLFLSGSDRDRRFSELTARHQSLQASKVKYNFRHAKLTLREIDLIGHLTEIVLENDNEFRDRALQYDDQIDNSDYFLDLGDR